MDLTKANQLTEKLQYVNRASDNIQYHLRNSIELELLMKLEEDGLGHWTLTQLLNTLQEMHSKGETESFYALNDRRKPIEKD